VYAVFTHKYSFKLCSCILFNEMFESFSAELIPKELEMDAKNVDCDI
jgi:hypothetical protein